MLQGAGKRIAGRFVLLATALTLAACDAPPPTASPPQQTATPPERPAPQAQPAPSEASRTLALYYSRLQADLLARGLLRTDGGGRDTPYTARELARNFELIAFYDEYERGAGLRPSSGQPVPMRRWTQPVRVNVEFGASVPQDQRGVKERAVSAYVKRLTRASGHPVSMDEDRPNMHVLVYGEDDREDLLERASQLVPTMSPGAFGVFRVLPRNIHCFVMAFSGGSGGQNVYRQAIVLIRAEHPDLFYQSCVHEELAQGLGLANDTPRARPSVFNDDDEFALLTDHDERLLRMLYDPRLRPGITLDEARPIIAEIAEELMGGAS